jgi:PH (Pleckstrin Homology) domain-containing protein
VLAKRVTGTIYQSRIQRIGGAVTGVVGAVFGVSMILESQRTEGRIFAVLFLFTYVPICIRFARSRVEARPDGVFIANVFSNRSLRWDEIEGFEMGRWMLYPSVLLVRLRDGGVRHAFGIQERTNYPDESAGGMEEELNAELARRTGGGNAQPQATIDSR